MNHHPFLLGIIVGVVSTLAGLFLLGVLAFAIGDDGEIYENGK